MMAHGRKSPIKRSPLRDAGASTRDRFNSLLNERLLFWIVGGAFFIVAAVQEWVRYYQNSPPSPKIITGLACIACVLVAVKVLKTMKELRCFQLGLSGEKAVAEKLDELRAHGFHVIHDLPGDSFNVDHVVVGPTGVFVIETKTRSKVVGPDARVDYDGKVIRVAGFEHDRDPVKQVRALSDFIRTLIKKKIGLDIAVQPVVVFPGWWVNEPKPTPEVWVLNETRLLGYIKNERTEMTPERIQTVSSALKDHVRTWRA